MKLLYFAKRLIFRLENDGYKDALNSIIFRNKHIIVIEKELKENPIKNEQHIEYIIADKDNYHIYEKQFNLFNLKYYCEKEAECLIGIKDNICVGFQWWTKDKNFTDLNKLKIKLQNAEAYLFDLYILPKYRGTNIPIALSWETYNYLINSGINKIYGFYYQDNIKALWWHRATLRAKEVKRIVASKFMIFEIINGNIYIDL